MSPFFPFSFLALLGWGWRRESSPDQPGHAMSAGVVHHMGHRMIDLAAANLHPEPCQAFGEGRESQSQCGPISGDCRFGPAKRILPLRAQEVGIARKWKFL